MARTTTSSSRTLAAVVLAAGKGKRLKSAQPKVLHPICGKPALWHVVQLALAAKPNKLIIVVGPGADDVRAEVESWRVTPSPVFVEQTQQLGTGHAVMVAEKAVGRANDVLVLGGDFDPVTPDDVRRLVRSHRRTDAAVTLAATSLRDPGGYGRIVREGSRLVEIVEELDASATIRAIREVSIVLFAFRRSSLFKALPRLDRKNRQREYYLNRVVPVLLADGERAVVVSTDTGGVMGLNSRGGLAAVERVVRLRINETHLANGVTLVDPDATYIDVGVRIGPDTVVQPNTFLQGDTSIGRGCSIGPSTRIVDSQVGDGSEVTFSVVEGATIHRDVTVGPFARLRSGAILRDEAVVGNFVEVKDSSLGPGSKAKHLTYLGNVEIGSHANIGAGTITVNFDGYAKHRTVIEDGASVGSDTMLVAPVRVGKGAMTGAGSVITKDVPAGALAVERSEQKTVQGYRRRKDAEHRAKGKREGG